MNKLMKAFRAALVHDLDTDGFADMYAQTIAYGLLSARIADPHKKTVDDFASHMRTNPLLRDLMEMFLKVGGRHNEPGAEGIDFDELGVAEVVELLDNANMEAVVRDFGDRNRRCCTARSKSLTSLCRLQSHPAQYVSGIPSAAILLSISHPIRCSTRCLANVRARISGPMIAL